MGRALLLDFLYKPRMLLNSSTGKSPLFILLIYGGSAPVSFFWLCLNCLRHAQWQAIFISIRKVSCLRELVGGGKTVQATPKRQKLYPTRTFQRSRQRVQECKVCIRKERSVSPTSEYLNLPTFSSFASLFSELLTFSSPLLLPWATKHSCPPDSEPAPSQSGHLGTRCGPSLTQLLMQLMGEVGGGVVTKEKAVMWSQAQRSDVGLGNLWGPAMII